MLTVWREPVNGHSYVAGVDTAEGLLHGDYSCIQMLDVRNGEQVAVWHGHIPPDELAYEVFRMSIWSEHVSEANVESCNYEGVDGVWVEDDSDNETVDD